jgi:hypothetical protein
MRINDAILALNPNITVIRGETAYDANGNEVAYDQAAVQAYVDAHAYIAKRAAEYPAITDQLDTIFHDGLDAWKTQIQEVKTKYPKGA